MVMTLGPASNAGNVSRGLNYEPVQYTALADVVIANSTAVTSLLSASCVGGLTLPALCLILGRTVRIKARGYLSTGGVEVPALLAVHVGSVTLNAPESNITAANNAPWSAEIDITPRSVGGSGSIQISGYLDFAGDGLGSSALVRIPFVGTAAATINTSGTPNNLDLTFAWVVADPANTITCTNADVELVGP